MPREKGRRRVIAALRELLRLTTILKMTVAVAAALCVAIVAAGGTYAIWNRSSTVVSASTVSASSASLSVSPLTAAPAAALYPGVTSYQTSSVTNLGGTPLALTLQSLSLTSSANAFSSALVVSIGVVPAVANCTAGFAAAWTGSFASSPTGVALATSLGTSSTTSYYGVTGTGGGASTAVVCVSLLLPGTVPSATQLTTSPTFSLTLGGAQGY